MSPQFYHPLLQWKGSTTLQDHGLHPYTLGLGVLGAQISKNEPRSFKEESRLILHLLLKELSIATTSAYWYG